MSCYIFIMTLESTQEAKLIFQVSILNKVKPWNSAIVVGDPQSPEVLKEAGELSKTIAKEAAAQHKPQKIATHED
jgi:hypothetical protein